MLGAVAEPPPPPQPLNINKLEPHDALAHRALLRWAEYARTTRNYFSSLSRIFLSGFGFCGQLTMFLLKDSSYGSLNLYTGEYFQNLLRF